MTTVRQLGVSKHLVFCPAAVSLLHTLPHSDKAEWRPTHQGCPCDGPFCGPMSKRFQGPHHDGLGPQATASPSVLTIEGKGRSQAQPVLYVFPEALSGHLFTCIHLWSVGLSPLSD
ncbi:LOW QUALITY PROTEIN: uncharacterized protein LOC111724008 [Otolemur garnettii]|uniref:LOW QUALITY PROTEIN: uncharacterized protein LOC111724008 n=1 Tax=Otolemur garnettii TaxID=30611 RepID=UPI000C7E8ADA|nr:LOW QUALITY PROTEIN: uncharacterized protein LOC111724008 [Otolemur garnettii]